MKQGVQVPGGHRRGFTLIELLVVVMIVAILAAIAVPNFLEAQTRSKVSRVKADLRTVAMALESYCMDHADYPFPIHPYKEALTIVHELTTPVAYLTSVAMPDPFPPKFEDLTPPPPPGYRHGYYYDSYSGSFIGMDPGIEELKFKGFCVASVGPDLTWNAIVLLPLYIGTDKESKCVGMQYDPTNGTLSSGDIGRWAGKPMVQ